MQDLTIVQPLLQRTINSLETASNWQRQAAKKAHMAGLQGEKRRLRYLHREALSIVTWIEHYSYDLLNIDICAQAGTTEVGTLLCPRSTMDGIIAKLWTIYNVLHEIANELVVNKYRGFATPLYKYLENLFCYLGELQRARSEYERADYEYHHISRYQVSWYNVHDEYEDKEEHQGYTDRK